MQGDYHCINLFLKGERIPLATNPLIHIAFSGYSRALWAVFPPPLLWNRSIYNKCNCATDKACQLLYRQGMPIIVQTRHANYCTDKACQLLYRQGMPCL